MCHAKRFLEKAREYNTVGLLIDHPSLDEMVDVAVPKCRRKTTVLLLIGGATTKDVYQAVKVSPQPLAVHPVIHVLDRPRSVTVVSSLWE
jgi:cobalamin-dependent methionine synthase I